MTTRLIAAAALAIASTAAAAQQTFRTSINIVPVDVRVVDGNGKPITDLRAADFKIEEDGVVQPIQVFSTQAFSADAAAVIAEPLFRQPDTTPAPRNRRVFLIVFGRGRHQDASKYVDALAEFIRTRVLPQDQVAFFAWNRGSAFTSDRAAMIGAVERYRDQHASIEMALNLWFSGLRAVYGSREIPASIQKDIDAVFGGASARPIPITVMPDARQIERDTRQRTDDLLRAGQLDEMRSAGAPTLPDSAAENAATLSGLSFDDYAAQMISTMGDIGNLYAGIGYMRHLDGEKHLIMLTSRGMSLPSQDSHVNLARVAADARVALDFVQTGGTLATAQPQFAPGRGFSMQSVPSATAMFERTFAMGDLGVMADISGGRLLAYRTGTDAFGRIADAMQFQYLLGYQPAIRTLDGRFRRIKISVSRPGARVLYRQGYFATTQLVNMDRREMITSTRMESAFASDRLIDHLKVTFAPPRIIDNGKSKELELEITVDVSRLGFAPADDRDVAELDVQIYAGNEKSEVVANVKRRVELKYTPDRRAEVAKTPGALVKLTIPYSTNIRRLKMAVYDYRADLIGTASTTVTR